MKLIIQFVLSLILYSLTLSAENANAQSDKINRIVHSNLQKTSQLLIDRMNLDLEIKVMERTGFSPNLLTQKPEQTLENKDNYSKPYSVCRISVEKLYEVENDIC